MARLVGRDAELQRVSTGLGVAGSLTIVVGNAGLGKSSLVETAGARASAEVTLVPAAASELQTGVTFAVIDELTRSLGDSRSGGLDALVGTDPMAPIDPYGRVIALSEALADRLLPLSPAALVVDDLQWIDAPSLTVLDRLLPRLADAGASLTVALRPDGRRDVASFVERMGDRGAVTVDLAPLDDDQAVQLVIEQSGGPVPEALVGLVRGAGGNPLFLVELARAIRAEGVTLLDATPPDFRAAILGRVARLPDETARILRTASILGRTFPFDAVAALVDRGAVEVFESLGPAIASGLLHVDGDTVEFQHDLVRQALFEDTPATVRRALHRAAASRSDGAAAVSHLVAAGPPFTAEELERIVATAREITAVDGRRAVELLELALANGAVDEPDVRVELVRAMLQAGDLRGAQREWLGLRGEPPSRLATGVAVLEAQGASDEPDPDLLERLWKLTDEEADDATRASIRGLLAFHGARADALRFSEQIEAVAHDADDLTADGRVHSLLAQSNLAGLRGDLDTATDLARRAHGLTSDAGVTPAAAVRSALTLGVFGGDLAASRPEAIAALDAAARLAEESGQAQLVPAVHAVRANALWAGGDWEGAELAYRTARSTAAEAAVAKWEAEAAAALTHLFADRGETATARSFCDACRELVGEGSRTAGVGRGWVTFDALEARMAWGAGDDEAAIRYWTRDLEHPDATPFARAVSAMDLTVANLANGRREAIREAVTRLEPFRGAGPPVGLVLPVLDGVLVDDVESVENAAAAGRHAPAYGFAKVAEIAGLVAGSAGRRDTAVSWLTEARDAWLRCGAVALAGRDERLLARLGVRPEAAQPARPITGWEALTDAEGRVAELVADGLLYREVADELFISRRTVETHVASILRKLQLRNRSELAAAFWRRH